MKKKVVFVALLGVALLVLACARFLGGWAPGFEGLWQQEAFALGLHEPEPAPVAGAVQWNALAKGFEAAELPVLVGGVEADRMMLARIEPALFKFSVLVDPKGAKSLDDWVGETHAVLIVDGSYYADPGIPETPIVNAGKISGPANYKASHGAFVATDGTAGVKDLAKQDWRKLFAGAEAGMVSYPLLLAPDGSTDRVPKGSNERANRSFIAEDSSGRIVIGTTRNAFFSLGRLAEFLKASPLHLTAALNLDGGPTACQAVNVNTFSRKSYGQMDWPITNSKTVILPARLFGKPPMPIVLAVFPRNQ